MDADLLDNESIQSGSGFSPGEVSRHRCPDSAFCVPTGRILAGNTKESCKPWAWGAGTPRFFYILYLDGPKLPPRKLHDLKLAFSEYYLSLVLLQNYQKLNFTGFRKILKKYDKNLKRDTGDKWRRENVESASFHTSKDIDKLISGNKKKDFRFRYIFF